MKSFHAYRTSKGIGAVRQRLGLSQQLFATELGISRSLLSKVENKTRSLSTSALVKLAALEISLAHSSMADCKLPPHARELSEDYSNDYAPSLIHLQQKNCSAKAEQLQYQLGIMQLRYEQVRISLDQLEKMIEANADMPGRFVPGFLEAHRYTTLRKLNKCSQPAQAVLANKIALLRAAASLYASTARISGVETADDL